MEVRELAPGLWRWTAPHPDWQPGDGWDRDVGCLYWEAAGTICLIDPLVDAAERERFLQALDRDVERLGQPVAILLTVFWHERSAGELAERYAADIWAPEAALDRLSLEVDRAFVAGDSLPGGIEAVEVARRGEVVYLLPRPNALVAGDVLLGDGKGGVRVCPDDWFARPEGPAEARRALRGLLDRPLELLLPSHGEPVAADALPALERALAQPA